MEVAHGSLRQSCPMEPDVHDDTNMGPFSGNTTFGVRGRERRSWHEVKPWVSCPPVYRQASIVVSPFDVVVPVVDPTLCG